MDKKLTSLLLVLALGFSLLSGCASEDPAPFEDGAAVPDAADGADNAGPVTPSGDGSTIIYWEMMWGNAEEHEAVIKKVVNQFNGENDQGIFVDVQLIPWDGYYETFLTAVTSGAAPDVATGATPQPIQYAVMGESLELDPILEQWEAENHPILDEIDEYLWDFFKYDGKQYGIAFGLDPKPMAYRTDYFEEAGITELPQTWDDFTEVLRTLKETFPDKIPFVFAAADSNCNHIMSTFLASNQTGFITADLQPNFQSKECMEVLEYFKFLYDEELISRGTASYMSADRAKIYMAGEAVVWGGAAPNEVDGSELADVTAILPPLTGPSATQGTYIVCPNGIQGFNQTADPDAARAFIKWWCENNMEIYIEGKQGNFPARSSYLSDSYWTENPIKKQIGDYCVSTAVSMIYPVEQLYPQFAQIEGEQAYGDPVRQILTGMDPAEVAAAADAHMQEILETYAD